MGARITTRRKRGAVEVVVYWRDPQGRRHVRFFGQDRAKAEAFREDVDGPLPSEAHAPTLAVWGARWLERLAAIVASGGLRPPTLRNYRAALDQIAGHWLGARKLEELHRRDVKAWVQELMASGLAPTTVRLRVASLRACLSEAIEEGYVRPPNPAAGLIRAMRLPSKADPPLAPDVESTAAMLGALEPEARAACSVILYLGLRIGEALGLQWEDVDIEAREVTVARQVYDDGSIVGLKTRAGRRVVEIPGPLLDILRALRSAHGLASPWVLGIEPARNHAARQRWRLALKRAARATGYKGRAWVHGLRHTHAVGRLEAGADLDALKRGMGHSSIRVTSDLYGAHAQRRDREASDRFGDSVRGGQLKLFSGRAKK